MWVTAEYLVNYISEMRVAYDKGLLKCSGVGGGKVSSWHLSVAQAIAIGCDGQPLASDAVTWLDQRRKSGIDVIAKIYECSRRAHELCHGACAHPQQCNDTVLEVK